jgi:hypothetical protein
VIESVRQGVRRTTPSTSISGKRDVLHWIDQGKTTWDMSMMTGRKHEVGDEGHMMEEEVRN